MYKAYDKIKSNSQGLKMSHGLHANQNTTQLEQVRIHPLLERTFFTLQEHLQTKGVDMSAIDMLSPLKANISDIGTPFERTHLLLAVDDVDESGKHFQDIVWYSPSPIRSGVKEKTLVLKPGLAEIVEQGIGYEFHVGIGRLNLEDNILTHATEGFGPSATPIDLKDISSYGLDRMSVRMQRLLQLYCSDQEIYLVGTSMGTVVSHKLQLANSSVEESKKIDIKGVVNYVPALVDSRRSLVAMGLLFPVMMGVDSSLEIGIRTAPKRLIKLGRTLIESKPAAKDVPLLVKLTADLLVGIDKKDVINNTRQIPTETVTGTLDSIREEDMWRESEAKLHLIRGRGHGMATKPYQGARKITACLFDLKNAEK